MVILDCHLKLNFKSNKTVERTNKIAKYNRGIKTRNAVNAKSRDILTQKLQLKQVNFYTGISYSL
jgi:hypothetical protein